MLKTIKPKIIDDLLVNPGVGFIAAPGLIGGDGTGIKDNRGNPVRSYKFTDDSATWNHPDSGAFFCGGRWKDLEPRKGEYAWHLLDEKLAVAEEMGCMSVVRVSPYALLPSEDVPSWLRERWPDEPEFPFWRIDPNTTDYANEWARFVSAFAARYDGHPIISSVDLAIVGAWGEGGGTEFMDNDKVEAIVSAYADGFSQTPLQALLHDERSVGLIKSKRSKVGFRVDCLGDMGGFAAGQWSHMMDFYPQNIVNFGMKNAWERAPVVFEACWHMNDWYLQGWDIDYIIDESFKWHITSYNSKGTTVPEPWRKSVERWVRRMGYRYEIHRCRFNESVSSGGVLNFELLLSNSGVAPCYHNYQPVLRLTSEKDGSTAELLIDTDIREWMPDEDVLLSPALHVQNSLVPGKYKVSLGFPVPRYKRKTLMLAIEGRDNEGFYPLGDIEVK